MGESALRFVRQAYDPVCVKRSKNSQAEMKGLLRFLQGWWGIAFLTYWMGQSIPNLAKPGELCIHKRGLGEGQKKRQHAHFQLRRQSFDCPSPRAPAFYGIVQSVLKTNPAEQDASP
jgi:hypothetical protein